jgi:hypothetical protein
MDRISVAENRPQDPFLVPMRGEPAFSDSVYRSDIVADGGRDERPPP